MLSGVRGEKQINIKSIWTVISNNTLGRNTAWMLVGNGGKVFLQGIYFIILARSLGVGGYGIYAGALALVFILVPFAGWGSGKLLIMHVSRNPASFPVYWGNGLVTILLSGSILTLIVFLLGVNLLPNIPLNLLLILAIAEFFFGRLLENSADAFQAFELLRITAMLNIMIYTLRLGAVLLFVISGPQITPGMWACWYLLASALSALVGLFLVHIKLGKPKQSITILIKNLKDGFYFALGLSSQSIYQDIDKTMLVRLSTFEAAGIYTVAYRIMGMAFIPVLALLNASYAQFFKHGKKGIIQSFEFAKGLLPYSVGYGLVAVLLLLIFAPVAPFLLGEEYSQAVQAIRWLSMIVFFQCIQYFISNALTGAGYQKIRSCIQMTAAVLNIALNLWLIPLYAWKGAIWASIITDGVLVIVLFLAVSVVAKSEIPIKEEG